MNKILSLLFLLLVAICAFAEDDPVQISTSVISFGNYNLTGKTFYVVSGNPDIEDNDLEFQYYADIIKQILIRNRATPTNDYINADMVVLLDFSIADASYQAQISLPVWGKTGISSITTTSNTYGSGSGNMSAYGSDNYASAYGSASGSSTTNTTQNINYNHGITGYRSGTFNITRYVRALNLYTYDNKLREGEPVMLWKVNATSKGRSSDLSYIFPFMAEVVSSYVGRKSSGGDPCDVYENDPTVQALANGEFLKDNVIIDPMNFNKCSKKGVILRFVELGNQKTTVALQYQKDKEWYFKLPKYTCIVYIGEKFHVTSATNVKGDILDKRLKCHNYVEQIMLSFPVALKKGDTFDLVAYKNKDLTKVAFSIDNITLE